MVKMTIVAHTMAPITKDNDTSYRKQAQAYLDCTWNRRSSTVSTPNIISKATPHGHRPIVHQTPSRLPRSSPFIVAKPHDRSEILFETQSAAAALESDVSDDSVENDEYPSEVFEEQEEEEPKHSENVIGRNKGVMEKDPSTFGPQSSTEPSPIDEPVAHNRQSLNIQDGHDSRPDLVVNTNSHDSDSAVALTDDNHPPVQNYSNAQTPKPATTATRKSSRSTQEGAKRFKSQSVRATDAELCHGLVAHGTNGYDDNLASSLLPDSYGLSHTNGSNSNVTQPTQRGSISHLPHQTLSTAIGKKMGPSALGAESTGEDDSLSVGIDQASHCQPDNGDSHTRVEEHDQQQSGETQLALKQLSRQPETLNGQESAGVKATTIPTDISALLSTILDRRAMNREPVCEAEHVLSVYGCSSEVPLSLDAGVCNILNLLLSHFIYKNSQGKCDCSHESNGSKIKSSLWYKKYIRTVRPLKASERGYWKLRTRIWPLEAILRLLLIPSICIARPWKKKTKPKWCERRWIHRIIGEGESVSTTQEYRVYCDSDDLEATWSDIYRLSEKHAILPETEAVWIDSWGYRVAWISPPLEQFGPQPLDLADVPPGGTILESSAGKRAVRLIGLCEDQDLDVVHDC